MRHKVWIFKNRNFDKGCLGGIDSDPSLCMLRAVTPRVEFVLDPCALAV